jgi:hypothetical protein
LTVPPTVLTLGGPDRAACFDDQQQPLRARAFVFCLAMGYEDVASEADEMV